MTQKLKQVLLVFAVAGSLPASALEVVFDEHSPQELRDWVDASYLRQQMEVTAPHVCKVLYGGTKEENYSENLKINLFLSTQRGGNPAFASGRKITWKAVGYKNKGPAVNGVGVMGHEMTHVLDLNTKPMSVQRFRKHHDSVMDEATAVWVTDYKVKYGYQKYSSPSIVLDRRYHALRHCRKWGKYRTGAGFYDFLEQAYGEGTAVKIIRGLAIHGKNPWEKVLGKTMDQLLAEWRQLETIYDPVFQWNYNGTAAGAVRNDKAYCGLRSISAEDAADKSGAWLKGATGANVGKVADGCLTIALHGRFPKTGKTAIASLGAARSGNGKAILLATTSKTDVLAAHVVATVPSRGCQVVSTTPVPVPGLLDGPHSVILTVKGGDVAAVVVDGKPKAKIDLKTKCDGCSFSPVFAVGGMSGGIGVAGFAEPRGEGGVLLDDVRVFTRTFRSKESASYAATFGPDYRGAVAVEATWRGAQGDGDIDNPRNWICFNSYGEQIVAVPTKETEVKLWFRALPSIPPKAKFACKSFTIDGLVVADRADIDLRGVRIVELTDNTRIITTNGHHVAVNAIRAAGRVRLDGSLAVTGGLKIAGNLELKAGSVLRLPDDPKMAFVKSISFKGAGPVALRPCETPKPGLFRSLLRIEAMPEDLTRLRLNLSDGAMDATFKAATGGKFLGVSPSARQGLKN